MAIEVFARAVHSPRWALSVSDALKRALRTGGEFPPPLGEVSCEIVEQTAPVARTFAPPLVLWTFRNGSGYLVLDGTWARTRGGRPDAAARLPLGPGTYRIVVRGDYYQDRSFTLVWPPPAGQVRVPLDAQNDPENIDLLPGAAYPLPDVTTSRMQLGPTIMRGSLFTPAGDPVAGVLVEAINLVFQQPQGLPPLGPWPFTQARTDDRGDWAIVLPGRLYFDIAPELRPPAAPPLVRPITVRIHLPNVPPLDLVENVTLGSEHAVRNTALRGQAVTSGGGPLRDAVVTTTAGGAASVTRANGLWFLYFDLNQADVPNVTVTVTAPGGATASDSTARIRHGATIVVPTFHFA
jgi:hypothetical protein